MDEDERLMQELRRIEALDRELQLDDETQGEDTEMALELLAARVKAARHVS